MDLSFPKRPFRTHGGAHVPHRKNTAGMESRFMPPPATVTIAMTQHIGAPCTPSVKKGDKVYVGTKIADSPAYVSAPIHSSVSGTVKELTKILMPGGQYADAVVIESDGQMEKDPSIRPPEEIRTKEQLVQAAHDSGLVGLGGAGFPAHVKLNIPEGKSIDTLIVNVAECEPYLTADHREALENGENILHGIYKIKEILDVHRVLIAIEDNKPDAIQKLTEIADNPELDPNDEVRILPLRASYPQGAEKVLVQACTGRCVPAGGLPADVGCLVMNIASVSFLASYMKNGMPLTMKRVTVDGSAVKEPQNVIVPVGTKISDLIEFCGGLKEEPHKIIMGGPMMGVAVPDMEVPVLKQNNGILVFGEKDAKLMEPTDCIRCGRCVAACPMHLVPSKLEKYALRRDTDALEALDIASCMECGCCAFTCPAGRRIVQAIRLGKADVRKAAAAKKAAAEKAEKEEKK